MSPLHKFVSLFQSDSKNQKKLINQKIFSSEVNICSDEFKASQWAALNGFRSSVSRGDYILYLTLISVTLFKDN